MEKRLQKNVLVRRGEVRSVFTHPLLINPTVMINRLPRVISLKSFYIDFSITGRSAKQMIFCEKRVF